MVSVSADIKFKAIIKDTMKSENLFAIVKHEVLVVFVAQR